MNGNLTGVSLKLFALVRVCLDEL